MIPQLTDHELEAILEAAAAAGARHAAWTMLRLPLEVAPLFREWLDAHYPLRAAHVMSIVRQIRGGKDYESRFGVRMGGRGEFADLVRTRFALACKRFGLNAERDPPLDTSRFRPPREQAPARPRSRRCCAARLARAQCGRRTILARAARRGAQRPLQLSGGQHEQPSIMSRSGSRASSSSCSAPAGTRCWDGPGWRGSEKTKFSSRPNIGHSPLPYIISLAAGARHRLHARVAPPQGRRRIGRRRREDGCAARTRAHRHDARAELRIRGAPGLALAHQRRLHDRRHGDHGGHRRPLEESAR